VEASIEGFRRSDHEPSWAAWPTLELEAFPTNLGRPGATLFSVPAS
jgi:hypothetical protein